MLLLGLAVDLKDLPPISFRHVCHVSPSHSSDHAVHRFASRILSSLPTSCDQHRCGSERGIAVSGIRMVCSGTFVAH